MEESFAARVPNDLNAVPVHREQFVSWWGALGMNGDELCAWQLIFDELVNNSIEHGCKFPHDEVTVESRVTIDCVELRVIDPGEGILSEESFPHESDGVFAETGRGAGLFLVRTFTDEIRIESSVNGGTLITVVKYRVGKAS